MVGSSMKTISDILQQTKTHIATTQQQFIETCVNPNISHSTLLVLSCLYHFAKSHFNEPAFLPRHFKPLEGFTHHAWQIIDEIIHNEPQVISTIGNEFSNFYGLLYVHKLANHHQDNEPIALIWKNPWEVYVSILAQLDSALRKERLLLPALVTAQLLNKELALLACPAYIKEQSQLLYRLLLELDTAPFGSKACEHSLVYVKEWLQASPMIQAAPLTVFIKSIEQQIAQFQRKFSMVNIVGQVPFDMQQLDVN